MINQLEPGGVAPDFEAVAVGGEYGDGKTVKLADFRGLKLVLYFYPKDDTPGCTKQACEIRDAWTELIMGEVSIFGVSVDDVVSHSKFISKYRLPFPLLSDPHRKMVEAYGVWVEKSMYGKKYMGTERTTFVIGADGRIEQILRKVAPAEHLKLLLAALA